MKLPTIPKPDKLLFFLVVLTGLFSACEDIPEFDTEETIPVLEAFLFANEPVDDIAVKQVIPFDSTDQEEVFISGLDIEIDWNGRTFMLEPVPELPGRYRYPGEDLQVITGDTYEIHFDFAGQPVSGSTTVPAPPQGVTLGQTRIWLPQIEEVFDLRRLVENKDLGILLEWDNPQSDYHFIVIENIEPDPEPIDLNNVLNFNFEFTSQPIQSDFFTLAPFVHYTQFGTHRIIVYRVNEEYALLYESLEQDSRDLNEPFSNVDIGVGVFSAFASDTVFLEVRKE